MAQPIKRTGFEVIEEAGFGAVKTGARAYVGTFLASTVAFAAIGAAVVTVVALLSPIAAAAGIIGSALTVGGALAASAPAIGIASAVLGAGFTGTWGTLAATVGGAYGLMKGASKANEENALYAQKSNEKTMGIQAEKVEAYNQGAIMAQQTLMPQVEQIVQQARAAERAQVMHELKEHAAHAGHEHAPHKEHGHETKFATHANKGGIDPAAVKASQEQANVPAGLGK